MTVKEKDILAKILEQLDTLNIRSERVERGMYGDPENNVKGLIQRQDEDEANTNDIGVRLEKLEANKRTIVKAAGWLGGGSASALALWQMLKQYIGQ